MASRFGWLKAIGWGCAMIGFTGSTSAAETEPSIPPVLLQMARDPAIHQELDLSSDQREAFLAATDAVDKIFWPSRILPMDQQAKISDELSSRLWSQLILITKPVQRERLTQLQRQATGTRMLLRGDVADELKLGLAVRQKIREIAIDTDEGAAKLQKELQSGKPTTEISKKLETLKDRERQALVDLLSVANQRQIGQLVGTPFDFSKVTRSNPRAPELIAKSDQWINTEPLKLKTLRGKVVVLHFYAFQCINCQRNLPHYSGWFDDFSSDDVVFIGIQTPETAAERSYEKIAAAVEDEKIQYPILFDQDSENWKAWGNTMWPTVYLIDRDGFIRTWWQGELNWQGGTGEQQYRQFIRDLVAEKQ